MVNFRSHEVSKWELRFLQGIHKPTAFAAERGTEMFHKLNNAKSMQLKVIGCDNHLPGINRRGSLKIIWSVRAQLHLAGDGAIKSFIRGKLSRFCIQLPEWSDFQKSIRRVEVYLTVFWPSLANIMSQTRFLLSRKIALYLVGVRHPINRNWSSKERWHPVGIFQWSWSLRKHSTQIRMLWNIVHEIH